MTIVALAGSLLVVTPLFDGARGVHEQTLLATSSDQLTRDNLAELAKDDARYAELHNSLLLLRRQITAQDELLDAPALAAAAARSAGGRVVAITFANGQIFAAPTGVGIGEDGTATAPQATAQADTPALQLPVRFEVEVASTAQAAAFIEGLRAGPRLLQVVQAQCSPTNDAKLFTVTVDALIFAVRG
ncbi:MAG: hypothetical protein ACOH1Y_06175 [Propionicimonas sp.]